MHIPHERSRTSAEIVPMNLESAHPVFQSRVFHSFVLFFATLFICLFVLSQSRLSAVELGSSDYGAVLNLSGKQRMLSQKMSKEAVLIKLGYQQQENLSNLKATANLFDKTMRGLRDGDADLKLPPTESRRILRQIDKNILPLWETFHATVNTILSSGTVTDEQLDVIATSNVPLLDEMNKCVKLYEKEAVKAGLKANPGLAVSINLSGKQRMLSQKMSKEFLLIAAGYKVADNKLNLQETAGLFERTLTGLLDGDATLDLPSTTDNAIREQLGKVQAIWQQFKPNLDFAISATGPIPADKVAALAQQNLPLLTEMNKAVTMYEALAAN